jgi:hypothetical protein
VIDSPIAIRSATKAPAERAATARPGRRSLIALLAAAGGGCASAGATLPWLTVYHGLDSYVGTAGTNGRLLAAGGAAAALLGLVYCVRASAVLRYLIGGLGFLLALLSAYLLAQLLSIYHQLGGSGFLPALGGSGFLPALGPGVFLGAGGALLILSTLFVRTEPDIRAISRVQDHRASVGPVNASLIALSAAAGTIHLTVASDHFAEYFLFGLFFVIVGGAQIVWAAIVAISGPQDRLLMASIGNALIVALWVASRTTGVPIGPNSGVPEPIGYADAVTTVFELLLVGLALILLFRTSAAPMRRSAALWSIPLLITPITALAVLSAVGAIGFLPIST